MDWEIWGLPWISYPRVDRFFELHSEQFYKKMPDSWLKEQKWIDRAQDRAPDAEFWCDESRSHRFKKSVVYPIDDVIARLPFPYLENSIAYMLALARHEHLTAVSAEDRIARVGLWGVHMFSGPEAEVSQPSVAYHVGLLQGAGVEVQVPDGSPLFMSNYTAGRYGVWGGPGSKRPKIICYAGVAPYE
jgi:hypothetical protein